MRMQFLKENYIACWKFLQEIKWYVVFTVGVFALAFLIGFAFPIFFRGEIIKFITEMSNLVKGKGTIELIVFIFLNNVKVSLMTIVLGIAFGIFPLTATIVNGYILGFVARQVASLEGITILWKLLPHGVFELPAIIFSIGMGIKIGRDTLSDDAREKLKHNFSEGLRFFIFIILPLLLVAGIIEGTLIHFLG